MQWNLLPIPADAQAGIYIFASAERSVEIRRLKVSDNSYTPGYPHTHYMGPFPLPPKKPKLLSEYSVAERHSLVGKRIKFVAGRNRNIECYGILKGFLSHNWDILVWLPDESQFVVYNDFDKRAPFIEVLD